MSLNFHWMFNGVEISIDNLKSYSNDLDENGYKSMLLVYDPKHPEYFVRVANIIDKSQKIKYMFAVRTYAISPEYLSMMCESFEEIDKGRISLNVCAGNTSQMENEKHIDGLVDMDSLRLDAYERVVYTRKWAEKFVNLEVMSNTPELIFSGDSDYTVETANMYGSSTLCMYNSFNKNPKKFTRTQKTMVSVGIIVSYSKSAAEEILNSFNNPNAKDWTIYGTAEEVRLKLLELSNKGVTDILISNLASESENYRIHEIIKSFNKS